MPGDGGQDCCCGVQQQGGRAGRSSARSHAGERAGRVPRGRLCSRQQEAHLGCSWHAEAQATGSQGPRPPCAGASSSGRQTGERSGRRRLNPPRCLRGRGGGPRRWAAGAAAKGCHQGVWLLGGWEEPHEVAAPGGRPHRCSITRAPHALGHRSVVGPRRSPMARSPSASSTAFGPTCGRVVLAACRVCPLGTILQARQGCASGPMPVGPST